MIGAAVVLWVAGEAALVWHAAWEHVRWVRVAQKLTLRVCVSMMLLVSRWGRRYVGTAPAGLAVIFLQMHRDVSGFSKGTLQLGHAPVGVAEAMRNVRVLAFIRAQARIQVLMRDVGIVMTLHCV